MAAAPPGTTPSRIGAPRPARGAPAGQASGKGWPSGARGDLSQSKNSTNAPGQKSADLNSRFSRENTQRLIST